MASTQKVETSATKSTEPKNGSTSSKEVVTEENAETSGRRGAVATMPAVVVYKLASGRVKAVIFSPKGGKFEAEGKGMGSAIGELVDSGFTLSALKTDGPVWIADQKLVPENVEILGYASVAGFPLPPQS